jgi:predicted transcriptional regulator
MDQPEQPTAGFTEMTAEVVSAYIANNSIQRGDLTGLIISVHEAFQALVAPKKPAPAKPEPAVSIRKSVTPDFLISLEDGRKYKSLKRHLRGLGLTPEEYRTKWNLPHDYPMVAPGYAQRRSELAKSMGLGQARSKGLLAKNAVPDERVGTSDAVAEPKLKAPAKGRRKKAA